MKFKTYFCVNLLHVVEILYIEKENITKENIYFYTLKELIFAGTKFREFRGFWGSSAKFNSSETQKLDHPRNLIPAKFFVLSQPRNFIAKFFSLSQGS